MNTSDALKVDLLRQQAVKHERAARAALRNGDVKAATQYRRWATETSRQADALDGTPRTEPDPPPNPAA